MAARCGGFVGAVRYWLSPPMERPMVPTFPLDQLRCGPLDRVVAVLVLTPRIVAEPVVLALGLVCPTLILDDCYVATPGEVLRGDIFPHTWPPPGLLLNNRFCIHADNTGNHRRPTQAYSPARCLTKQRSVRRHLVDDVVLTSVVGNRHCDIVARPRDLNRLMLDLHGLHPLSEVAGVALDVDRVPDA